jgi:hypothetical protein
MLNSGLVQQCAFIKARGESEQDHYQVSSNTPDFLMAVAAARFARLNTASKEEMEELYIQFYNAHKVFIEDMDITQLREHRDKLAEIAHQARAELASAEDKLREMRAKSGNADWLVTPVQPQAHSDALNVVKVRKERMTKLDKIKEQLEGIGIDQADIDQWVRNMERGAKTSNLKAASFRASGAPETPAQPAKETNQEQAQAKPAEDKAKDNGNKPWNPFAK